MLTLNVTGIAPSCTTVFLMSTGPSFWNAGAACLSLHQRKQSGPRGSEITVSFRTLAPVCITQSLMLWPGLRCEGIEPIFGAEGMNAMHYVLNQLFGAYARKGAPLTF